MPDSKSKSYEPQPNAIEAAKAKHEFLLLVRHVRNEHLDKDSSDESKILDDAITRNANLWAAVMPVLARDAAMGLVRSIVKRSPWAIDNPQSKLFEDLPARINLPNKGWKGISNASLAQLRWHTDWYEKRLKGSHARTERDQKTLEGLKHLINVVSRYSGKDDSVTVKAALEERERRGVQEL